MHISVLPVETAALLVTDPAGVYVDGTLGGGGHAKEVLDRLSPEGRLIGIDRDEEAIRRTKEILKPYGETVRFFHGNFSDMKELCKQIGVTAVNGVLLDLGISSPQVDTPERGFSFSKDGPLDMRMDPSRGRTAADWVNEETEETLADVIFRYGEDRDARRIARAIVQARQKKPVERTLELAEIVSRAKGGRRGSIHPSTQTFQALRMAVNDEMESIRAGLEDGLSLLRPGGRMTVISFHSLEDRLVKECFKRHSVRRRSLQQGGEELIYEEPAVRILTRKPVTAGEEELKRNPRARSARLRAAEREAGE